MLRRDFDINVTEIVQTIAMIVIAAVAVVSLI